LTMNQPYPTPLDTPEPKLIAENRPTAAALRQVVAEAWEEALGKLRKMRRETRRRRGAR
jgi:hypothetical protein